jgi:hypothetical protein
MTGWSASGNFTNVTSATFQGVSPTNGTHFLALNDGNRTPNALISQIVPTTFGQSYTLSLDIGISGYQSTAEQRLQVKAVGATTLVNQTESIFGIGTGSSWSPRKSYTFIADSSSTTISFTDVTPTSNTTNLDMLLDNVTLTGASPANYQWRKDGTNITGATAFNYNINPVTPGSFGVYDVVVTNGAGSTLSDPASLNRLFPLQKSAVNPRYFTDGTNAVYLTGEHIPTDFQLWTGAPPVDFVNFTDTLQAKNHNLLRLWNLDTPEGTHLDNSVGSITPVQFSRSSTPGAADGNKFDLTQLNQSYFDQLRSRVITAGSKGIYVAIMLTNGLAETGLYTWNNGMYNPANNINGGTTTQHTQYRLSNTAWVNFLDAYADKVVDTVNDLDNVLYEISNEANVGSSSWQDHVIARIKAREASLPKQHMLGKTSFDNSADDTTINNDLSASGADWVSFAGRGNPTAGLYTSTVPYAPSNKVSILDTDHTTGFGSTAQEAMLDQWVWKSLTHGHNPEYITPLSGYPGGFVHLASVESQLGYAKTMADRCDLLNMIPDDTKSSAGTYGIVNLNKEYLVYQPSNASFTVTLPAQTFSMEWMNPVTGALTTPVNFNATAGANTFNLPSGQTSGVLHLVTASAPSAAVIQV